MARDTSPPAAAERELLGVGLDQRERTGYPPGHAPEHAGRQVKCRWHAGTGQWYQLPQIQAAF